MNPVTANIAVPDPQLDLHFMQEALRQARKAAAADEVPVGAIIVDKGRVIGRAHNQVELLRDATAHAEMLALTQAQAQRGDWRLTECTLYVTKEPCPMCAGAILLSRVDRVVFGVGDPKMGGVGGAVNILELPGANHSCAQTSGVLADESLLLLQDFFRRQRQNSAPRLPSE